MAELRNPQPFGFAGARVIQTPSTAHDDDPQVQSSQRRHRPRRSHNRRVPQPWTTLVDALHPSPAPQRQRYCHPPLYPHQPPAVYDKPHPRRRRRSYRLAPCASTEGQCLPRSGAWASTTTHNRPPRPEKCLERRRHQARVLGAAGGVLGCGQMRSWVSGFLSFVLNGCLPRPCSAAPSTTIPFRRRTRPSDSRRPRMTTIRKTRTTDDEDRRRQSPAEAIPVVRLRPGQLPSTTTRRSQVLGTEQPVSRRSGRMGKMGTYDAEEQRARNERGCVLPVCYGGQNKLTTGWSALDRDVAAYRPRIPIPLPVSFDVRGHRRAPRSVFPLRRASWPAACPAGRTVENPVSGARRYGSVGMYIPETHRA
jgi:hypothetical protein